MAIHDDVAAGDLAALRTYLGAGGDVDARDYRRFTLLHRAAGVGQRELVALLLDRGADARALNTYAATPLHEVAGGGGRRPAAARIAIVERLLAAGCPIDAQDSTGRTALWYAAATSTAAWPPDEARVRLAVLDALLARGADRTIAARGTQGTPLDAAHGRHQSKKYARAWPEAVAVLSRPARRS
ncbi:MAG: ankyrin repeat domain-containing protein [Myxococcales bacterium]|nr:ankyrin repeat domain-containing protein [Myxococcales bacterium]